MGAYQAGGQLQFLHRSKALELWGLSAISLLERRDEKGLSSKTRQTALENLLRFLALWKFFLVSLGILPFAPKVTFD